MRDRAYIRAHAHPPRKCPTPLRAGGPHLPDDRAGDYDVDALEALFDSYVNTYRVPRTAAFDSIRNHVLNKAEVDTDAFWASPRDRTREQLMNHFRSRSVLLTARG